jgi:hypothetical protein
VSDDVRRVQPLDPSITEAWARETDEPDLRAVDALKVPGGWQVDVWVMEFIRTELETELRERLASALRGVGGVASAEEEDREVWFVTGNPSGQALAEAAAGVVDEFADRTRT